MTAALSVVLMLPTVMGLWTYALPAFAGILILFIVIEIDKKWAFGVFVVVSILSLMLLPNKEAAVFYTCFFGHYPIIKALIEGKKLPRAGEFIIKIIIFNICVLVAAFLSVKVLGIPLEEFLGTQGETASWTAYAIPIMLVLGNIAFIAFDALLSMAVMIYLRSWQKKFRKMFPFK